MVPWPKFSPSPPDMGGEGRVRGVPAAEALLMPPSDAGSILHAARPPHPALSPGQRGRGGKRGPAGDRAFVDFALARQFDSVRPNGRYRRVRDAPRPAADGRGTTAPTRSGPARGT